MGWWWNSSAPQQEEQPKQSPPSAPNSAQTDPSTKQADDISAAQRRLKPLSRDEIAEAELQELLGGLKQNDTDKSKPSTSSLPSSSASTASPSSFLPSFKPASIFSSTATESPPPQPDPASASAPDTARSTPSSIAADTGYPTTMSCRTAFDYAFFCQSPGGQWVNVYRYGQMRPCTEHWSDFWFCMRTMSYPKEQKEKMIADRYRKKDIKYKTGPSSEDIWELRQEPVIGAFQGDYVALEREMEKAEAEAREAGEGS